MARSRSLSKKERRPFCECMKTQAVAQSISSLCDCIYFCVEKTYLVQTNKHKINEKCYHTWLHDLELRI